MTRNCLALVRGTLSVLVLGLALSAAGPAAQRTWIGGDGNWTAFDFNWNPTDEPDPDDEAIFNTANVVNLANSFEQILALTLSGGIDLSTNNNDMTITGLVQLAGTGTNFTIGGSGSLVVADDLAINSGATVKLTDGGLTINKLAGNGLLDINAGGTFSGRGTVNLIDSVSAGTILLDNNGTLSAYSDAPSIILPPPIGILSINANDADARVDLDGTNAVGIVNVFRNQTLDVNVRLSDAFSGDMNLFHNSTLDIANAWSMDLGTLDVDNGFVNALRDIPADVSFIRGGTFTQTGGTINVVDADGTLQVDAEFVQSGGSLVNNGLVIFNANASIQATADFTLPTSSSGMTVRPGVTVTIHQPNFDADGPGTTTNTTTIDSQGILNLNLGAGGDESLNGTLNLNGGALFVQTLSNSWTRGGTVNIRPGGVSSSINGDSVTFANVQMTIEDSATLALTAPSVWSTGAHVNVDGTGVLVLNGSATFNGPASLGGTGFLRLNDASTVTSNTTINTEQFDWDGVTTGQTHTINAGATFQINSPLFDVSDGDMDDRIAMLGHGSQLLVNGPTEWHMFGTLDVNMAGTGNALIGGASRMILHSTMNVDGNTTINAPVTFGVPSAVRIDATKALTVNGETAYSGALLTGAGRYNPPTLNTVTGNTTISTADFQFERGNWTVESGALLAVNVQNYDFPAIGDSPGFESSITLNGSSVEVETGEPVFEFRGTLNMNSTPGAMATWDGETLRFRRDFPLGSNPQLNVGGNGTSKILSAVDFGLVNITVAAGATLLLEDTATFSDQGSGVMLQVAGGGAIATNGQVNFPVPVTFAMPGGTLDLDGQNRLGNTVNVNAPVVANIRAMNEFGTATSGVDVLTIDNISGTGSLTVNLDDPNANWTLNTNAVLNLLNENSTVSTLLDGNDINLHGTINVQGAVRSNARVDIGGVIHLPTNVDRLTLSDGQASTLQGGTISGLGILTIDGGLQGFGTLENFLVRTFQSESLLADNGVLTLATGVTVDVHRVGTADADGVLNIPHAWSTQMARSGVVMSGGIIQGGTITNDVNGGISGFGTISARVINESLIKAAGETLVVQTAGNDNDWDGLANNGRLDVQSGTLDVRDNATFAFQGSSEINVGGELLTNGFAMEWEPGSSMRMFRNSKYHSTHATNFGGGLTVFNVGTGDDPEIQVEDVFRFESTSATSIAGTLRLNSPISSIDAGASFLSSSSAVLLNAQVSNKLRLQDGVDMRIAVQNQGILSIGDNAAAQALVGAYRQEPSANWQVDLAGTDPQDFDQLNLNFLATSTAELAGTLDVRLLNGFVPAPGDSFDILTASVGIHGSFDSVLEPGNLPQTQRIDLLFNRVGAIGAPAFLRLRVLPSGDFNGDSDFDCSDVNLLVAQIAAGTGMSAYDLNGDAHVDTADLTLWLALAGEENLSSGNPYLRGDANLDGVVDGSDFNIWNSNKFSATPAWCSGDFTADGAIDGSDFNLWNSNKFTSSDSGTALVPEPRGCILVVLSLSAQCLVERRRPRRRALNPSRSEKWSTQ